MPRLNGTVLDKILFGSRHHESPDPALRVERVQALPPDAKGLAQMLRDPAPEVRSAVAARISDASALAAALTSESEAPVRSALETALGRTLAVATDESLVRSLLAAPECTDAVRAQLALHATDEARRRSALDAIGDEEALVEVALAAEHAAVRAAAAEGVHGPEALRRLFKGARDRDAKAEEVPNAPPRPVHASNVATGIMGILVGLAAVLLFAV